MRAFSTRVRPGRLRTSSPAARARPSSAAPASWPSRACRRAIAAAPWCRMRRLNVRAGEAVGLLGPNGAGKTTIFYMITGLVARGSRRHQPRRARRDAACPCTAARGSASATCRRRPRSSAASTSRTTSAPCSRSSSRAARSASASSTRCSTSSTSRACARRPPSRSRAASGGAARSPGRSPASRPSCCSTSPSPASIPIAVGDIQNLVRHLTRRGIGVLITDHNVRETLGLIDRAYIIHSGRVLTEGRAGRDRRQRGRAPPLSRRGFPALAHRRPRVLGLLPF